MPEAPPSLLYRLVNQYGVIKVKRYFDPNITVYDVRRALTQCFLQLVFQQCAQSKSLGFSGIIGDNVTVILAGDHFHLSNTQAVIQ